MGNCISLPGIINVASNVASQQQIDLRAEPTSPPARSCERQLPARPEGPRSKPRASPFVEANFSNMTAKLDSRKLPVASFSPTTQSMGSSNVGRTPEIGVLGEEMYKMSHPKYGQCTVKRLPKTKDDTIATFEISLGGQKNQRPFSKSIYICNHDPDYQNQSTIGYSDIFLPDEMQNMRLINLLHFHIADSAKSLGVEKVVVSNVVSSAMHKACERAGMEDNGNSMYSYSGTPDDVSQNCLDTLKEKGWLVETSN